jgi:hypothetical protein
MCSDFTALTANFDHGQRMCWESFIWSNTPSTYNPSTPTNSLVGLGLSSVYIALLKNKQFIHLFIHSSKALQPFPWSWPFLQFRKLFYTDGWSPWTGDQPVARPLPTHRHPCLEWDSNPRSQCWSNRRQFMP